MNNTLRYHDAWKAYRKAVSAARDKYKHELARLEPYKDSKQGAKDIEAAKATFEGELEAARAVAEPAFKVAIDGMKSNIAAPDMTPPTAEQLNLLTMLNLRDSIEANEIEAAAKVMGNNDAALRTLRDVLTRKGRVLPSTCKTMEAQVNDAVHKLQVAASHLMLWDGRTGDEVLGDYQRARHDFQWAGGNPPSQYALASRDVADVEAASTYRETVKNVIGEGASTAVIDALG